MCMYSSENMGENIGEANNFHLNHYSAHALGGNGLIIIESTAVSPEGRISPWDLGIWNEKQVNSLKLIASSIIEYGSIPGIQLNHAGRKASTNKPWLGGEHLPSEKGGWETFAPSKIPFPGYATPKELDKTQISQIIEFFRVGAKNALEAGFKVIEIHAAHGYLIHQFLSPLSNQRTDEYGGSFENRIRFLLEIIAAIKTVWPDRLPIFVRLSATDWVENDPEDTRDGWTVADSTKLAEILFSNSVDLIDISSAGNDIVNIPNNEDYQTKIAVDIIDNLTNKKYISSVGRIVDPYKANELIEEKKLDAIFVGRALLKEISWPNNAYKIFNKKPKTLDQYSYAIDKM